MSNPDSGYLIRSAQIGDVDAVVAVCNAYSLKMRGVVEHNAERQLVNWQRSGFCLDTDTRVVLDATGALIAYGVVTDTFTDYARIRGAFTIHPEQEPSSLGEALLQWIEDRSREAIVALPEDVRVAVSQLVDEKDEARSSLLLKHDYHLVHHTLRMRRSMTEPPELPTLPKGLTIRSCDRRTDLPSVSKVVQESFRNHWGFVKRTLSEDVARYERWLNDDPGIDLALWHLACLEDEVVGVCLGTTRYSSDPDQAYIYTLGVRDTWRGQGIGRALLRHAFAAFYHAGKKTVDLDVDTQNLSGALRLYEGEGMQVRWQINEYEKELRAGTSLTS